MAVLSDNNVARVLLADVGGTNVRFAVLTKGVLGTVEHLAVRDYAQFGDALAAFLQRQSDGGAIRSAILAVAGVVKGERCELTNYPWLVDGAELRARFGFAAVRVINDFEAVAWSLPHLARDGLRKLGGGEPVASAPMLALGPGTGLGVAAYVPGVGDGLVLRSEAGHATLPSGSQREDAIVEILRHRFEHVSAERVLSGGGLENLYRAIATLDQSIVPDRNAAAITQAALADRCPTSRAALDTLCALLGEVAGNLALVFRAEGGVFIAGGIVAHLGEFLPRSQFRARFEAKGRFRAYLAAIPVYLILHGDPAFVGLRSLALQPTS